MIRIGEVKPLLYFLISSSGASRKFSALFFSVQAIKVTGFQAESGQGGKLQSGSTSGPTQKF